MKDDGPRTHASRTKGCRSRILQGVKWLIIALIVLAGLGAVYQAIASSSDRQNHPPVGELVNVGDYNLHLYCIGEGSPTVVLIAGSGNIYAHWDLVQTGVAQFTRVCSYDRAGTGWSEYPSSPPDMEQHVDDLHHLLNATGETEPVIIVGHSIGGIQARAYYEAYPDDVRAMVLVDSSYDGQYQHLPSIIRETNQSAGTIWSACQIAAPIGLVRLVGLGNSYAGAFASYSEESQRAISATFHRTENCRGLSWESAMSDVVLQSGELVDLGDLPLVVLTRGLDDVEASPGNYSEQQIAQFQEVHIVWGRLQAELATLSTNSTQIIAEESGHFIQLTQPELVISAIQDVIELSRPE